MHSTVFVQGNGGERRGTVAQSGVDAAGFGLAVFGGSGLMAGMAAGALAVGSEAGAPGTVTARGQGPLSAGAVIGAGAIKGGGDVASCIGTVA